MSVHSLHSLLPHHMLNQSLSGNQEKYFGHPSAKEGMCSWGYLDLGIELRGMISVADGRRFLEAELSQPKWDAARSLTTAIARIIEGAFDLEPGVVQAKQRYVDVGQERMRIQANFGVIGVRCPDNAKLIEVLSALAGRIVPISDVDDVPMVDVSGETRGLVDRVANDFLETCGGKRIGTTMQIVVDQKPIATLSRGWCNAPKDEDVGPVERTLEAYYDGRRLRSRILFVMENSNRGKVFEIFYDEERFDEALRGLGDDKRILLSLIVKESKIDKDRSRYELVSFQRVDPPTELVLC